MHVPIRDVPAMGQLQAVEEPFVVADHEHCSCERGDRSLELFDRLDVEVVGRDVKVLVKWPLSSPDDWFVITCAWRDEQ